MNTENSKPSKSIPGRWSFPNGNWEESDNSVTFHGGTNGNAPGIALHRNTRFLDGVISASLKLAKNDSTTGAILFGFRSPERHYFNAGIGAFNAKFAITEYIRGRGWFPVAHTGSIREINANRAYDVEVRIRAQRVVMKVDGFEVLKTTLPRPLPGNSVGLFTWDKNTVEFQDFRVKCAKPRVFVVMPFRKHFGALYELAIQAQSDILGVHVHRADARVGPGRIYEDMCRDIAESHAVLGIIDAGNSGKKYNANVFYELGYAHALNKPTILLASKDALKSIPIDIRGFRLIKFNNQCKHLSTVRKTLTRHLKSALRGILRSKL